MSKLSLSFFLLVLENILRCKGAIPVVFGVHGMQRHLVTRTQKGQVFTSCVPHTR